MSRSDGFLDTASYNQTKGRKKLAAFDLHQAAERYISCLLLVHTGYRPKEHDMEKLLRQAAGLDTRYDAIFPNNTREEKHLFDLLRRAYIDARYSKNYRITEKELQVITQRVEQLKTVTDDACKKKIALLKKAAIEELRKKAGAPPSSEE
jgi:HEPN domain-containing protein